MKIGKKLSTYENLPTQARNKKVQICIYLDTEFVNKINRLVEYLEVNRSDWCVEAIQRQMDKDSLEFDVFD